MKPGIALLAAAVVLWGASKALAADEEPGRSPTSPPPGGEPDADILGRVIIVELGSIRDEREVAGIVHVALNRRRLYGYPLGPIVRSRVPKRSEWGAGCGADPDCDYNRKLDIADRHPNYPGVRAAVARVLDGAVPNPIGRRFAFLHPMHATFTKDRATGTQDERRQAAELRRRAAATRDPAQAATLWRQALHVERVPLDSEGQPKWAWVPNLNRYLPSWSVEPSLGGAALNTPLTIGGTRFS